jgi:hypothetical protein
LLAGEGPGRVSERHQPDRRFGGFFQCSTDRRRKGLLKGAGHYPASLAPHEPSSYCFVYILADKPP